MGVPTRRFSTVLAVMVILVGCVSGPDFTAPTPGIAEALAEAKAEDTKAVYEDFLVRFKSRNWHDLKYKQWAMDRLREIRAAEKKASDDDAWNKAARLDTVVAYERYLGAGFNRHEDAARRGLLRRHLRDAAETGRAYLSLTQAFQNAPNGFSMALLQEIAETVYANAGVQLLKSDLSVRELNVPVHTIKVKGTAWQQSWYLPAEDDNPASATAKLYTGYRIDIGIATSVGEHRTEESMSFDASVGEYRTLYADKTLSDGDINAFREPGGIFSYFNSVFAPRNQVDFGSRYRQALFSQLMGVHGCEIALRFGDRHDRFGQPWDEGNKFWDDLIGAIKAKQDVQSVSECEITIRRRCELASHDPLTSNERSTTCSNILGRLSAKSLIGGADPFRELYKVTIFEAGPRKQVVTDTALLPGVATPASQRCYVQEFEHDNSGSWEILAEMIDGRVAYLSKGRKPYFIDKYCRFTDGSQPRP